MATIAIGDIHGNLAALTDLLDQLLPDAVEGDVFVFLGDYVDESLLTHYQTPDCICVHAGVHPSFPAINPQFHPRDSLVWGAREFPDAYAGTEVVVYGHRNNAELAAVGCRFRIRRHNSRFTA